MNKKTSTLFCGKVKNFLCFKIIFYASVNALLLTGLFLTKFATDFSLAIPFSQYHLDKNFLEFIPLLFLIFPCFMLLPTIFGSRGTPSVTRKSELEGQAYEKIIPSIDSWLRNTHFLFRIGMFLLLFIIILPVLNILIPTKHNAVESNILYYLVLFIYGAILWRYLKIYTKIEKDSIVINDHGVTFPVFGFLKTRLNEILFKNIKGAMIYVSCENVEMTLDDDLSKALENLMNSSSIFIQGICIWDAKGNSYIASDTLISFEDLYEIHKKLPGDKIQLISEFS